MFRQFLFLGLWAEFICSCTISSSPAKQTQEDSFFRSPYVRRCLQYEKEKMISQAEACWQNLLDRIQSDPQFVQKAELSADDVERISRQARASKKTAEQMDKELKNCTQPTSQTREQRIECLEKFLATNQDKLSYSEKYEIKSTIAALKEAQSLERGEVESTLEHAGKMMGLKLYGESGGIRIEKVASPPALDCVLREQGLVLMVGNSHLAALEASERIHLLETCSSNPLQLLVRYGEMDPVEFQLVEIFCGQPARCKVLKQHKLPAKDCTEEKSPELTLGLNWCYFSAEGLIQVNQVCPNSPAARANLRPGQQINAINGRPLLGMSRDELNTLLRVFPAASISFHTLGSALEAPLPLAGPPLDQVQAARCWENTYKGLEERHTVEP